MEDLRKVWRALLSPPVLLSAVGMGCLMLVVGLMGVRLLAPAGEGGVPTSVLTVVAGATSTSYVPTATATRVPTATSNIRPSPLPGLIGVGSSVQIFGTEGSGLNIRVQPGLGTEIRFVALDSEVFEVRDGPEVVDEITWWYLVTPLDENRAGWAAANYLSLVSNEGN
ncbi:MAG: SH3 domain-containing protein [Anaerolineales bacterium]|jgi:hypothetical protein